MDQFLALSPAERAERDTQYRVRALEQDRIHQREQAVKQAAYERWLKQGMEPIIHPLITSAPHVPVRAASAGGED